MREKLTSIIRHLFTGASAAVVDAGVISQADADSVTRLLAAAFAIIISRVIIFLLSKLKLGQLFKDSTKFSPLFLCMVCTAVGFGVFLPSCVNPETGVRELPRLPEGIKGSLTYRSDRFGGEYGVECDESGCAPKIYQPFIDEQGNVVGEFELAGGK